MKAFRLKDTDQSLKWQKPYLETIYLNGYAIIERALNPVKK